MVTWKPRSRLLLKCFLVEEGKEDLRERKYPQVVYYAPKAFLPVRINTHACYNCIFQQLARFIVTQYLRMNGWVDEVEDNKTEPRTDKFKMIDSAYLNSTLRKHKSIWKTDFWSGSILLGLPSPSWSLLIAFYLYFNIGTVKTNLI